ncbi:LysR family transcriptional regulator [Roseomonas sp. CCTCC AB2023176]|uniref:LysR family transcriptional regulator n=1 Tax=Roseomonas sp. CCTCC AB2023176 TaxID=3342640 RepID=UPI0035DDC9B4
MDLPSLRLLFDVARRGSFAAVAKDRGTDPSSVSRAVAALEAELGLRLFQRTTRRMAPTEAGDRYLRRIEPLVEELDRANAEARTATAGPTGTLRLTSSVSFGQVRILPTLPAFRARYPDLRLDLLLTDANLDLVAERVDLAIRLAPAVEGDHVAAKLADTRYRVVASAAYLHRQGKPATPHDLAAHRCLLFPIREFRTRWTFRDATGRTEGIPVEGDITISSAMALRDAAIAGLGPALLADWLVDAPLAEGTLLDVFPEHDVTATTFSTAAWLVYPSRAYLPEKVRAMITHLRATFARAEAPPR